MDDAPEHNDYDLDSSDSIGVYCIEHFYDMADQRIYIKRVTGDFVYLVPHQTRSKRTFKEPSGSFFYSFLRSSFEKQSTPKA